MVSASPASSAEAPRNQRSSPPFGLAWKMLTRHDSGVSKPNEGGGGDMAKTEAVRRNGVVHFTVPGPATVRAELAAADTRRALGAEQKR